MIRWIKNILIMLLPYGLIITWYKYDKALPGNIRTSNGNIFKAILLSENYGIICSENEYIKNRTLMLDLRRKQLETQNKMLTQELNELSFEAKEKIYEIGQN